MWVLSLDQEDPLEKEMVTHSIILAWEIPWTESLVCYSPWGCKRVGHDLATKQQQQKFNYSFLSFLFETLKDSHLLVSKKKKIAKYLACIE